MPSIRVSIRRPSVSGSKRRSTSRGSTTSGPDGVRAEHKNIPAKSDDAMLAARALLNQKKPLSADDRRKKQVANQGVKQSIYLGYINRELTNESNCMEFPATFLSLLSFSIFAIAILRQEQVFAVENALEFDITENANFAWAHAFGHKTIEDVNSVADFWSWLRLGYLPLVVQPQWAYSEAYPSALGSPVYSGTNYLGPTGTPQWNFSEEARPVPITNDYLRHNRIIGGIRMTQKISPASYDSCRLPISVNATLMKSWLGKACMPSGHGALTPEPRDAEEFNGKVRAEWMLPELDDLDELKRLILDMEDGCSHASQLNKTTCRCQSCKATGSPEPWINEQTTIVEISFFVYNAEYGIYSYVGTNFFFNRGGHIHKHIHVLSAWSDFFARPLLEYLPMVLSGGLWTLMVLNMLVSESMQVITIIRKSIDPFWRAIYDDYLSFWNIVDWISLSVSILTAGVIIDSRIRVHATNALLPDMMRLSIDAAAGRAQRGPYLELTERFFAAGEHMVLGDITVRLCFCFYPYILMARLFKSFSAQPRLAIVTNTLIRASSDLIHFGIVFVCVFLCLVMNSVLFFGQDIEEFSSLPRAVNACFRAMFGEWDHDSMEEVGLLKSRIWLWSFLLIIILMLLNLLLAVFKDAYTAEKAVSTKAQSVAHQCFEMFRRFRQFKRNERVRLNDIWDYFDKIHLGDEKAMLGEERLLTPDWLTARVEKLQDKQAKRTLENALIQYEASLDLNVTEEHEEDIKKAFDSVESTIAQVLQDVHYLCHRIKYYDTLQAPGDPEYDFHFGAEGLTVAEASREAVSEAISGVSQELSGLFVQNLRRIEIWQSQFEKQQDELHSLIAEIQIKVRQQAWSSGAIAEAVLQLSDE